MCSDSVSRPREPLFLTRKYIDPASNALSQRKSTTNEKPDAIRSLVNQIWPDMVESHYKALQNIFAQLVAFHHRNRFSPERIATSIAILIEVLLILSGPELPQPEFVFSRLKAMLLRHSIRRTPFSIAVFSLIELKLLTRFFLDRVLRYCHLYQYLLGKTRHLQLRLSRGIAPSLSAVLPLAQAITVQPEPAPSTSSSLEKTESESESITDEQIQMILSDPVAKARFESLVQPKLAQLQSQLDNELEKLDRLYAGNKAIHTS